MALRGIESQILAAKTQEISSDRSKVQQNNSTQQGIVSQELQKESSTIDERTAEVSETENASVGLEDRRSKPGEEQDEERKKKQQEEEVLRDEVLAATQKLANLPVERGRFAKREEHKIDIIV